MSKIAILGANGNLGRESVLHLEKKYQITEYTSKSDPLDEKQKHINEILESNENYKFIIFFCYSTKKTEQIKIETLLKKIITKNIPIILISTFTIYSIYQSSYNNHKTNAENIVKLASSWIIVRPGLVHGNSKKGLFKIISKIRKFSIILLLNGNSKTGFVHINQFVYELEKIISINKFNYIRNIFYINMEFITALRFFGFRGKILNIKINKYKFLIKIVSKFSRIIPSIFESYLNLLGMDENKYINSNITLSNKWDKYYLKRLFFYNHINFFGLKNKFLIYKKVKEIIKLITLREYLELDNHNKFLYHAKLHEVVDLDND